MRQTCVVSSSTACSEVLRPLPLFAGVEPAILADLAAHGRVRSAAPREVVLERGEPVDGVVVVLRGQVAASMVSLDGVTSILGFVGEGTLIGDAAILDDGARDGGSYAVTITAVLDVELLWLEARAVLGAMSRSARFACNVARQLARRLRMLARRNEWIATMSVPIRLANFLVWTADQQGTTALNITHEQLGGLIGVSRETVNKHLRRWVQAGWIAQSGRTIVVLDRERLLELEEATQLLTGS
jgi:CRP/FNR family transcriptional regulator